MRILFFGLDYHTYTQSIIAEMVELGGKVTYVDIQPRNTFFKVIRTLARPIYERYSTMHHASAIRDAVSVRYDKVIFLQAHQISLANLLRLRKIQSSAEFTLYNWDAISNHDYRPQAKFFDRVLTFDRRDAEDYGYEYLPLFCQRSMQCLRADLSESRAIFMVGNIVTPQRYEAIESFRTYCTSHGLIFRQYLKITPVIWAKLVRLGMRPTNIYFKSISHRNFCEMMETSDCAFDFANHAQSGQTMRMMESLCAGKKVITNNAWVKSEPFYSPDRIHVLNGLDYRGVYEFLGVPLEKPKTDLSRYHIQSFTKRLLGLKTLYD